jgi:hypothetical protein
MFLKSDGTNRSYKIVQYAKDGDQHYSQRGRERKREREREREIVHCHGMH